MKFRTSPGRNAAYWKGRKSWYDQCTVMVNPGPVVWIDATDPHVLHERTREMWRALVASGSSNRLSMRTRQELIEEFGETGYD